MTDIITMIAAIPQLHMWVTIALIVAAVLAYSSEKIALETTSLSILSFLLLFFYLLPLPSVEGSKVLSVQALLNGFANPALVAVMALLVVGQAVVRTGALNDVAALILRISGNRPFLAVVMALVVVVVISGVLNNTPVVVIFIPIIAAMARQLNKSASAVMMPLSYAAILGGMTTLIGSSTNLLVSGELRHMGLQPLQFFEFLIPGSILAGVGLIYIFLVVPRILPDRAGLVKDLMGEDGPQFIAQFEVEYGSVLAGLNPEEEKAQEILGEISIRMVQRGEHAFLPPFDESFRFYAGDTLIVATTRKALTDLLASNPNTLLHQFPEMTAQGEDGDVDATKSGDVTPVEGLSMAEIIVAPASRMIGMTLEQVGFRYHHHCIVLGVQRGQRMIRARMTEIRLAAGDVLLLMGKQEDILSLRENKDVLLMEWSTEELPSKTYARLASGIFLAVVGLAAFDIVPISVSAFAGATAVILTGCLNIRQALRALDAKIVFMVAASIGLSGALQATGGASFLAQQFTGLLEGTPPIVSLSSLFIVMALFTNVLSNNASAVLFTPIAINMAHVLGVDPYVFAYAVIFACNCSFATPIGYQTNLLVMAPGHYTFVDFMRAGIPMVILIWITYTAYAHFVYLS